MSGCLSAGNKAYWTNSKAFCGNVPSSALPMSYGLVSAPSKSKIRPPCTARHTKWQSSILGRHRAQHRHGQYKIHARTNIIQTGGITRKNQANLTRAPAPMYTRLPNIKSNIQQGKVGVRDWPCIARTLYMDRMSALLASACPHCIGVAPIGSSVLHLLNGPSGRDPHPSEPRRPSALRSACINPIAPHAASKTRTWRIKKTCSSANGLAAIVATAEAVGECPRLLEALWKQTNTARASQTAM